MDKMTQVMVSSKASSIKTDMKKNMSSIWSDDKEEKPEQVLSKKRSSLKEMSERREKEKLEREDHHRKRSEERQKVRNDIREKYKLKGSTNYDGTYDIPEGKQSELSRNSEKLTNEEKKPCTIQ